MALASVSFTTGEWQWVPEREGVGFTGQTALGPVDFLVTGEALAEMLNPDLGAIDREMAAELFQEYEADVHRIARREFVRRLGGEPPILITAADVAL